MMNIIPHIIYSLELPGGNPTNIVQIQSNIMNIVINQLAYLNKSNEDKFELTIFDNGKEPIEKERKIN